MRPRSAARQQINLAPGECAAGGADCCIHTLLGSCVSIVLWHARTRFGAMSHFLLANRGGTATAQWDGRYGDEAMQLMLRELERERIAPSECVGKIFGGGSMFPWQDAQAADVGRRNGEAARRILGEHRIRVAAESLFGVGHRQVIFEIASGDVWVRQVELPGPGSARTRESA